MNMEIRLINKDDGTWSAESLTGPPFFIQGKSKYEVLAAAERMRAILEAALGPVMAENAKLRGIVSECASAIGNGASIGVTCDIDFMALLPREIELNTKKRTTELASLHAQLATMREALEPFAITLQDEKHLRPEQVIECFTRNDVMLAELRVADFRRARAALTAMGFELKETKE